MPTEQTKRMQQVVQVAAVRKQRLANAAADARRKLAAAEEERANAAGRVQEAEAALRDAGQVLLQSPASDQMLIWRNHCAAQSQERIAEQAQSEDVCAEAGGHLAQSVQALVRQDLRHDHLAGQAKQLRHRLARLQEARIDDEAQGCGPQQGTAAR